MRINTNVAALNSYNQLKNTQNNLSQSLERLSSGKRINSAADDAAGLAISEKMNAQVRGLSQAQRNAADGISMIQTAEGALKESHSILQRMRELSVQSANDTNTDADRAEIQKEVDQLTEELTRIGETTEFNTQKLLDGNMDSTFQIGANEDQNMDVQIDNMKANALKVSDKATVTTSADLSTIAEGEKYDIEEVSVSTSSGDFTSAKYAMVDNDGNVVAASSDGKSYSILDSEQSLSDFETSNTGSTSGFSFGFGTEVAGTVSLEEGENTAGTGTYVAETGINVSSQEKANTAISTIDDAIKTVSAERSKLGAVQNRLDHTINNLGAAEENLTAAESRISDVDMAKEMMNMSKQQILQQAGTAMMAQANQMPQGVLQLLG